MFKKILRSQDGVATGSCGVVRSSMSPFQGGDPGSKSRREHYLQLLIVIKKRIFRSFLDRKNLKINPLLETYKEYITKIDSALESELTLYSKSEFMQPLMYAIEGGKRIRPLILLLAAECIGRVDENAYTAGCAVEFLHTESVIHDDIIDNETSRRHKDPFHIKYGYNASILTGDFVLGLILNISSRLNNPRITRDLANTAMLMSEGEIIEMRLETSQDLTFDDYLKVIEYKTATAFETAARLGAILGNGSEDQIIALSEYGRNIGIAYQIRDDLIDWKNEDKLFNLLVKHSLDPRDVFNHMEKLLKDYAAKATSSLRILPDNDAKSHLEYLLRLTTLKL